MYLFRELIVFALSPFGVLALMPMRLGLRDEGLIVALAVLGLALISAIPVGVGVLIAPHRNWKLAIGLLSIALILPMAALEVGDSLMSGDREFHLTNLAGEWASIAAGAILVYGVLRWLWGRRVITPAWSKRASAAILSAFALLLLLPVRTVTVPQWRLQFVDARGQPLAGLEVHQSWKDFSVDGQGNDPEGDNATTDAKGIVVFPERVRWASLARRLWRPVDTELNSFRHRPEGRLTRIVLFCPLHSKEFNGSSMSPMDFRATSLPDRLQLTADDAAHGGIDPSCERLLDQVRSVQGTG